MNKDRAPETHKVTITVDNGNFSYVLTSPVGNAENSSSGKPMIFARRRDTVVWECTNNSPFAIHFADGKTPMEPRYRSARNPIQDTVPAQAPYGPYTYMVAVCIGEEIWTDDPPFIVRPG